MPTVLHGVQSQREFRAGVAPLRRRHTHPAHFARVLDEHFPGEEHTVEVVAIVGRRPADAVGHWEDFVRELAVVNARVITYDELIERALADYTDYVKADRKVGSIVDVLTKLEAEVLVDSDRLGTGVPGCGQDGSGESPADGRQDGGDAATDPQDRA